MRMSRIKSLIAMGISAGAMLVAATASTMCHGGYFEEVKMPKSLYKNN